MRHPVSTAKHISGALAAALALFGGASLTAAVPDRPGYGLVIPTQVTPEESLRIVASRAVPDGLITAADLPLRVSDQARLRRCQCQCAGFDHGTRAGPEERPRPDL